MATAPTWFNNNTRSILSTHDMPSNADENGYFVYDLDALGEHLKQLQQQLMLLMLDLTIQLMDLIKKLKNLEIVLETMNLKKEHQLLWKKENQIIN